MSHGFLELVRYFLLALLWLFFIHAARMVYVEVRRSRSTTPRPAEVAPERQVDPPLSFSLRVVEPDATRGRVYEFGGEATLGRSTSCGLTLNDDRFVSTVHARVFQHDGELWIEDLGSRNGTYLNDRRVSAPELVHRGDRVKVGQTAFEVAR
jgi:pSer/pThr/pTyr-binding forkhead associated (FHA) protein